MSMIQFGAITNCNNKCKFCTIKENEFFTLPEIYRELEKAIENVEFISTQEENFTNKFAEGYSMLGGELFFINDEHYKELMLKLVDTLIEKVIKVSPSPRRRISTVTNGMYDPNILLYPVIDRIKERVGVQFADVNFSYDLDFRFPNEEKKKLAESTINDFHKRYNYVAGVQMILTQKLIDRILYEGWRPSKFIDEVLPGNQLALLYPHPIHRGNGGKGEKDLPGFNFDRKSFIKVCRILKEEEPKTWQAFVSSTRNSGVFKYTALFNKKETGDAKQLPILSDGKEEINDCGHSILYKCYSDTDRCMLCDLETLV